MDRFGRKAALLTLYSGFLVGTFLCGWVGTYRTLLAARVLTGAFGGILGGMALAIVGDVFPDHKRGRATGILMSAFALASVVGVPVGIYLGNRFDWHAPFLVLAVLDGHFRIAFALFVLAGITDGLDGLLARWLQQRTVLGQYLDPVADKLLLSTLFLVLHHEGLISRRVTVLVFGRDDGV